MATKIVKFKHLTDAQCVQFENWGAVTWHVFASEEDALRWKHLMHLGDAELCGVNSDMFFEARGVAVIFAEGASALVKLRGEEDLAQTWLACADLEDAETRVLRRIDELRECADFCGGGAYD